MPRASSTLHAPATVADEAGLRYVSDAAPGIQRLRRGKHFQYRSASQKLVSDAATLARIRSLAVPPAYENVWICPDPRGHIQATGRDARGRKQYRYHPRWHAARNETKFERMLAFSLALPLIREAVARDLARDGLPKEKVLAAVVQLLESTCIRIGNEEYARHNDSFGLTTLRDEHVEVKGSRVVFEFRGKRGKEHRCQVSDRRLARVIARCQAIPGEELFQYVGADGRRQSIDSGDVNGYLRTVCGDQFSAKDFRTWSATLRAGTELLALGEIELLTERRRCMLGVVDDVARLLNNTRAVSRKSTSIQACWARSKPASSGSCSGRRPRRRARVLACRATSAHWSGSCGASNATHAVAARGLRAERGLRSQPQSLKSSARRGVPH